MVTFAFFTCIPAGMLFIVYIFEYQNHKLMHSTELRIFMS